MKKQHLVAIVIVIIVAVWMFVPRSPEPAPEAVPVALVTAIPEGAQNNESVSDIFTVRVSTIEPQNYVSQIRVRGRSQAFRHVEVRAEQAGRIVSEPVARGSRVKTGDTLCEIAVDNRDSDLNEASSRREQAQFEYNASVDLQKRSLQSDVAVAQLKAALDSAKAAVDRAELALERTKIVAPFDGVVETRQVEIGDLLNAGTVCASVLDDDPMLLVGLIPEQDVGAVALGSEVVANLLTGETVTGKVSYLSRAADAISRSYRIEVVVDAGQTAVRDGITAELLVKAAESSAHLIPSSALTIADNGDIGVKLVDGNNIISFAVVDIIGDNTSQLNPGIWVHGLNGRANLVTHGQEIVFPGQTVISNYDWSNN